MNKLKKSLASVLMIGTVAMADISFYAGGGLAYEAVPDVSGTEAGMGVVLRGGINLGDVLKNFAAEAEITKSLIDPEFGNRDQDILTMAAYAVYNINIGEKFYVKPRFGVVFPNLGDDVVNSRDVTFSSSIGGGYRIIESMNMYVDYTVLGEGITNYGAGIEYRF